MVKQRKKFTSQKSIRKALYFQIMSFSLLFIVCLILSYQLEMWHTFFIEGQLTFTALLTFVVISVCIADIFLFAKPLFKTVIDLENAVNVLQAEAQKDGTVYDSVAGDPKRSLTDLLQLLLQREAAAQIMTKQAEINALQNQINPHFLYNTLETIRGQALCCGEIQIAQTTKALADIFRYNISKKGAMIYLSEELTNIDSYIKIQQIRFNDKFELKLEIDEDARKIRIPKLLVQPVIENALKHGLETKYGIGHIVLRAFRTEQKLEISVEDDGIGILPDKLIAINEKLATCNTDNVRSMQDNNIGLENISNRIKLIYGQDYGISVISAQNIGTKVTLSLGILPQISVDEN